MDGEEKKLRAARTTKKQVEIIINFLEANPNLLNRDEAYKWIELKDILNSGSIGPQKSISQWKSVSIVC